MLLRVSGSRGLVSWVLRVWILRLGVWEFRVVGFSNAVVRIVMIAAEDTSSVIP